MTNATNLKSRRGIFAPVVALSFNARQFEDLGAFLTRRAESTEVVPISDVEQLLMAADGRLVENGYRFNYLGFQSLCNGTAQGLGALFNELAGERQYRSPADDERNLAAAVSVYNTTIRAKIERLRERSLLVDNRERCVDGFMGLSHRMLDNSQFLELVAAEMAVHRPAARFYRAELLGRSLRLFWLDPASQRKDIYSDARHTIAAGWMFTNQEERGKSIHAVRCLLTKFGVAAEPQPGTRLAHVGADLVGRTQLLVARAAASELDMPAVLAQIAKLQAQPLGFVDDQARFEAVANEWVNKLVRLRVRPDDARLIVRNASMAGADLDARDSIDIYTRSSLASRTLYDLLCSLLRYARTEPAQFRDKLQESAMALLLPTPQRPWRPRKSKKT